MLRRKAYAKLKKWKDQDKKKALCIIGARQIGKTTLIRSFGHENYENFVEINFIADGKASEIFAGDLDANTILTNLTAYLRHPMVPGKTLVLFDEVQKCPAVRTAIKFLVEDGRFDYIESGSLLGVQSNEVKSYPVGFEEIYRMYPMDFEEFLWANGVQQSTIAYLQKCFDDKTPVTESVHTTMNRLFYSYIVIGGMPQVVQCYVDTHDIGRVIENQQDILALYRLDIAQYAEGNDKIRIKAIFDSIPAQLNDKKRRFYINTLDKNARLNRYDNSFKWLDDAGVALPCYNVDEPQPPLSLNEKHSLFKLFMNDTGLLCAACMDNIQLDLLRGNLAINRGSILENVMAQQLKAGGFKLYYYDSQKHGEVDFVVQNGMETDLIEVKSGSDYEKHKALDNILNVKEWDFGNAYVLCKDNLRRKDNVTYLPWYLVMFLHARQLQDGQRYMVDISHLNDVL
jgi:predicted AAA+ superfamily ATPase